MPTLGRFINGFSVWLWWLLACILGVFVGLTLSFMISSLMKSVLTDLSPLMFTYITFPSVGFTLGLSQWLLIRHYLPQVRRWILANALCYSLSLILWIRLDPFFEPMTTFRDYMGFMIAVIASLLLWLVIRRRFPRSLGWALVSGIGLGLFFYAIRIVGHDLGQSSGLSVVSDFLTFALSTGMMSGISSGILTVLMLGPVLSRDSTLVEGLVRLTEVSKFSTRPDIRAAEAPSKEPSFVKVLLVRIGLPLLTIGGLALVLWLTGLSNPL